MKENILKLWLSRTDVEITPDNEHYLERHPEDWWVYTKLYIYYDNLNYGPSRKMCEVPKYMFQEIKPNQTVEFTHKFIENE